MCGIEAANALLRSRAAGSAGLRAAPHAVLPVRDDEPQVVLGRQLNKALAEAVAPLGIKPPWLA